MIGHDIGQARREPPPARRPEGHLCKKQAFRLRVVQICGKWNSGPRLGDSTP
jgi:hypothetical protein